MISNVLKTDIDRYADELRASSRLLGLAKAGALDAAMVGRYFAGISYLIRHTPVHLGLAMRSARERGEHRLADFFEEKLREESGHHEWAANDLDRLEAFFGVKIPRDPAPAAVGLVSAIEDSIRRAPYLYLAYVLFTEYITVSMGPEWVDALHDCCGVPRAAMTVATHHIELDREHVRDGLSEIDGLVADASFHEPLRAMLEESMRHFSAFCDDVCNRTAA